MARTAIRVSARTRDVLQRLAGKSGDSTQAVLERAVEYYYRQQLLEAANAAYAALECDAQTWVNLLADCPEWDKTLRDGLEDA